MNYWLVKSEPSSYSWDQLVKDTETVWSGVRNYAARNNLRSMKKGDLVFYYHSNDGKDIVGIAKVVKESYMDPTSNEERWLAVDIAPVKSLNRSITLEQIKKDSMLKNMQLIKLGRLSVQSVTEEEFKRVLDLSGTKI